MFKVREFMAFLRRKLQSPEANARPLYGWDAVCTVVIPAKAG
jgi:hypothetical protein